MDKYVSTMRHMRMKREELLTALKENRENHREQFIKAQEGYRTAVIKELDQMLSDARAGNKIKRAVSWPKPEDHTDDYDHAIRMLEMCVEDTIGIEGDDFERLVMDRWGWSSKWTETASNYLTPEQMRRK